jgi:hypothetical protein
LEFIFGIATSKINRFCLNSDLLIGLTNAIIKANNLISSVRFEFFWDLLTYGAEPFLRSCQLCSHSRSSSGTNRSKLGIEKYDIALLGLKVYEYVVKLGVLVGDVEPRT